MNRLSRPLAVAALAVAAVLAGGAGAAQAAGVDLSAHGPLTVADQPNSQLSAANRCDVEYTVAYYSYRTQGYLELESMLHAEKSYALCQVNG
ncbi:hypothetical protein ACIF6L_19335 [Kitasatospora sp. NPDC086009]|uniref:hypothetical protein n=1 Tax=unclassified Kitasatospora TaxID=2633591 RepID=UPI0037C8CACD